jgi:hypothetical protein
MRLRDGLLRLLVLLLNRNNISGQPELLLKNYQHSKN